MTKYWLEMCGCDIWLGRGSQGYISYYNTNEISDIEDMANGFSIQFNCGRCLRDNVRYRSKDIFAAIRWYRQELSDGRKPGTHVIESDDDDRDVLISDGSVDGVPVDEYIARLERGGR